MGKGQEGMEGEKKVQKRNKWKKHFVVIFYAAEEFLCLRCLFGVFVFPK